MPFSVCVNRFVLFAIVAAGAFFLMCFVVIFTVIAVRFRTPFFVVLCPAAVLTTVIAVCAVVSVTVAATVIAVSVTVPAMVVTRITIIRCLAV